MSVNDDSRNVIDDSRAMLQFAASLTGESRGIIYDYNMLIVQATGVNAVEIVPRIERIFPCSHWTSLKKTRLGKTLQLILLRCE
jgi:hypothetical protein